MTKVFVKPVSLTEDMYGYSAVALLLTENNLRTLNRLQATHERMRAIDGSIGDVVYNLSDLNAYIFNDDFETDEHVEDDEVGAIIELTDEQIQQYADHTDNSYKVENPILRVGAGGVTLVWGSKYTSDEAYVDVNYKDVLEGYDPQPSLYYDKLFYSVENETEQMEDTPELTGRKLINVYAIDENKPKLITELQIVYPETDCEAAIQAYLERRGYGNESIEFERL